MKRAINIFTALILTVVVAFGSQVASAFALAQPNHFVLQPHHAMSVHVEPGPFKVTYINDNPQDIPVIADVSPDFKQTIVPSNEIVTEEFVAEIDEVRFFAFSYDSVEVLVDQQ